MNVKRITALLSAALLSLSLAGCTITAPASVGQVGNTQIPSGLYLLLQMNAYSDAVSLNSSGSGNVLNATLTVEEKEISGSDYVAQKTHEAIGDYVAVEQLFAQMNGKLSQQELDSAKADAQSMWASNGDLYTKNGVGENTLRTFVEYNYKRAALLEMVYGSKGEQAVNDKDLADYVAKNYRKARVVEFPLMNYSTFTALTEEDDATINDLAQKAADRLKKGEETAAVAKDVLPQVYQLLGMEYDEATATRTEPALFSPSQMAYYGEEVEKKMVDAKPGDSLVVDIGLSRLAMVLEPALEGDTVPAQMRSSALSEMKSEDLNTLLAENAEKMDWALDESAMKTYSPKKIKLA